MTGRSVLVFARLSVCLFISQVDCALRMLLQRSKWSSHMRLLSATGFELKDALMKSSSPHFSMRLRAVSKRRNHDKRNEGRVVADVLFRPLAGVAAGGLSRGANSGRGRIHNQRASS